jgi:hypothetical protein
MLQQRPSTILFCGVGLRILSIGLSLHELGDKSFPSTLGIAQVHEHGRHQWQLQISLLQEIASQAYLQFSDIITTLASPRQKTNTSTGRSIY